MNDARELHKSTSVFRALCDDSVNVSSTAAERHLPGNFNLNIQSPDEDDGEDIS